MTVITVFAVVAVPYYYSSRKRERLEHKSEGRWERSIRRGTVFHRAFGVPFEWYYNTDNTSYNRNLPPSHGAFLVARLVVVVVADRNNKRDDHFSYRRAIYDNDVVFDGGCAWPIPKAKSKRRVPRRAQSP